MSQINVEEKKREIHFTGGRRLTLNNVKWFDNSGSFLRLESDEGYILANPTNIDYIVIPDASERVN
jgi:hypothetical protein